MSTVAAMTAFRPRAEHIKLAEHVIDRAAIRLDDGQRIPLCTWLEAKMDGDKKAPGGRPRQVPVRCLLVGIIGVSMSGQPLHITRVRALLQAQARSVRRRVGFENDHRKMASRRQLAYLLGRVADVLDPSEHSQPDLDPTERAERHHDLQRVLDALLEATMPDDDGDFTGDYAIDTSLMPSWARGRRNSQRSRDPDAAWITYKKPSGPKHMFGYGLHAAVRVRPDGAAAADVPCVAERIVVTNATSDPAEAAAGLVERLARDGRTIGDILVDRGFTAGNPKTFHYRIKALGGQLVMDQKQHQTGPDGTHKGTHIIDGRLYCPAMPKKLQTALQPLPVGTPKKDIVAQQREAAKRRPYEMGKHAGPDKDGYERVTCPAAAGKVRCALKPESMSQPKSLPLAVKPPPKESAPACCTQKTVTVPPVVAAQTRQKHPWGTAEWYASYNRRNVVEGWFGNLKNEAREDAGRGRIRVMGLAKFSLLLAAWSVACNLRLLDLWAKRQVERDQETAADPFTRTDNGRATRARRRQDSLAQLLGTPAA